MSDLKTGVAPPNLVRQGCFSDSVLSYISRRKFVAFYQSTIVIIMNNNNIETMENDGFDPPPQFYYHRADFKDQNHEFPTKIIVTDGDQKLDGK